ncbi:MAG: quinolinate synthase NadA [Candidatus Heimdallarchaeota archaeon]|nr:quinolinate synthase NadA [Candidatus Heimdallarchaeota archaeon]
MAPNISLKSKEKIAKLTEEILTLKKDKNAVILAHYYQEIEIQDVADLVGDSLGLSKAARDIEGADRVVFAGVYFMAETAKLLNPEIKVFIPNVNAGCPLANQCNPNLINDARLLHEKDTPVVVYVNTTAETKAAADVTCTSSNAATVVKNLNSKKVIFGPDRNLSFYVQKKMPDIEIIPVPEEGHCYVHRRFDVETIKDLKKQYPDAIVIAHPECNPEVQEIADEVGSTSAMIRFGKETKAKTIIVATEKGLVDRLTRDHPEKKFILAKDTAICKNMKKITLENLRDALLYDQYEVIIPKDIHEKAEKAILRMFELS